MGSLLLPPGPGAHKVLLCPPSICFPAPCKFWRLYGGVNGDLLQEGLGHTHTQSPCPCVRPLPTRTSTGDTQTQFCLSLCGVPGSWCARGWFEPSEHLWQERGLILNANSPLLLSCWGFSFALGRGESPQSHSSAMKPLHQDGPQTWQIQCIQKTKQFFPPKTCLSSCGPNQLKLKPFVLSLPALYPSVPTFHQSLPHNSVFLSLIFHFHISNLGPCYLTIGLKNFSRLSP